MGEFMPNRNPRPLNSRTLSGKMPNAAGSRIVADRRSLKGLKSKASGGTDSLSFPLFRARILAGAQFYFGIDIANGFWGNADEFPDNADSREAVADFATRSAIRFSD